MPPSPASSPEPSRLDASQRRVLEHDGRPVAVVLGGPGTGKTTTVVELVRGRVAAGVGADSVLVLSPTRTSAARLRTEITAALVGSTREPICRTPASLAFALLRQEALASGGPAPTLLTGAEQDVVLRELLRGHAQAGGTGGPQWPSGMGTALGTRGFRDQLRDLLMRAVEHGLDGTELRAMGLRHDRPEWVAAADVLREYDEVTALQRPGAYDPAWICTAAADLLEQDRPARDRLHARLGLVVVDDAQELTASAARLLLALHHQGLSTYLVGDGDVAAQGFRGADPGRFLRLAEAMAGARSATRLVLGQQHRLPATLATAAGRVVATLGASGAAAHRHPEPADGDARCQVLTVRSQGQEAALVAATFRDAHLRRGRPWSQMAVVARSRGRLDQLRRTLVGNGIPVLEQAGTGALREQPAARALLLAYTLSERARDGRAVGADEADELIGSPLGGADPVSLHRLRHAVRDDERAHGGSRAAADCLAELVLDERRAAQLGEVADPLVRVARMLAAGAAALALPGATAHGVLWALWQAGGLAEVWRDRALRGGVEGAAADRDLDAVIELTAVAQAYAERLPGRGPAGFAEQVGAYDLAADSLVARARPHDAVEVLTPQAAAGRQWEQVAVVGVQEGAWPDLRRRDTLLGAQALVAALRGQPIDGADGDRAAAAAQRADETRLFHLAVTRASHELLVTAVASTDEQPSRYLDLLDPPDPQASDGDGGREPVEVPAVLSSRALVAQLRRELTRRHGAGDLAGRDQVAGQLARLLADEAPGADPLDWWAGREPSVDAPLRPGGTMVLSPSRVETFSRCELRWLLTSRGGERAGATGAAVGTLVHDVVAAGPDASQEELGAALDARWHELGLGTGWVAERERERAEQMLHRYSSYQARSRGEGMTLVAVEQEVDLVVDGARIVGRIDRVEQDPSGAGRVVDLKTGGTKPPQREMDRHPQLGVYQVAMAEGAVPGVSGDGGAALVQLGRAAGKDSASVQPQRALARDADPGWAHRMVQETARGMAGSSFRATLGTWCRGCPVIASCPARTDDGELG